MPYTVIRISDLVVETVTRFRTILQSMPTSVRVHEDAKSRLKELRAEIRLQTGRNVTQQELLTRLMAEACESREEVDRFVPRAIGPALDRGEGRDASRSVQFGGRNGRRRYR